MKNMKNIIVVGRRGTGEWGLYTSFDYGQEEINIVKEARRMIVRWQAAYPDIQFAIGKASINGKDRNFTKDLEIIKG